MELSDDEIPTAEFLRGIREFNAGQFFDCHETLESAWKKDLSPRREFTQGIIQTAVAFYHLNGNNRVGAIKLLHKALPRLRKFGDRCYGITTFSLAQSIDEILLFLESERTDTDQKCPVPPQIEMTANDKLLNH